MDYEYLCKKVCTIAEKTGSFIHNEKSKITNEIIEKKGIHDFVTYVDKTSEKMIISELQKLLPESSFIAEENTVNNTNKDYKWVIDPLDGTTNYIHGLSPYAISIALLHKSEVVIGVVYEVSLCECFYAWKNSDAFLNGKIINVSNNKSLNDSLISTGFPYYDFSRISNFLISLEYFLKNTHGVRRLGSAATDLAYVACGRFDAFYEYSLHPWDVAAGAFIVERAGGKVSDFKGENNFIFGSEIIASNKNVYNQFLEKIKVFFN